MMVYRFMLLMLQTGWSAIMTATKNGHEDVVKYLVEHGSNVHNVKEV